MYSHFLATFPVFGHIVDNPSAEVVAWVPGDPRYFDMVRTDDKGFFEIYCPDVKEIFMKINNKYFTTFDPRPYKTRREVLEIFCS